MPIADKALFDQGRSKLTDALRQHAITKPKGGLNTYGTAVLINILNEAGGLPTSNFSSGRFEGAAKIAGEAIFEGNKQRMGKELTTMPAARAASSSAPTPGTSPTAPSMPLVSSTNRTGPWAPTAASIAWTTSPRWCGCATPMAWIPSRPAPPSAWPWRLA